MFKLLLLASAAALCLAPGQTRAQASPTDKSTYMQVFYEGSGWLAGRPVVHYSPAFQGKTGEVVREDSTSALSPTALMFSEPMQGKLASTQTIINGRTITYVPGADGKMREQTAADVRQQQAAEKARFTRTLNLLETRAALGRATLLNSLNATAAAGWEVVQLSSWGTKDGLVYLLRRR